jgi:S1-C subfamily serine protease
MMQARIFPDTIIAETAGKLSPDRFANLPPIFSMGKVKKVDTSVADDFKNVVDRISPSIVRIVAIKCFGKMGGSGSGSVVGDGLVVTNAHVVEGSSEIYIESQNGIYPANSIVIDEAHDVAVIYSKYFNLEPIPISSQDPETGSRLIALGYPGGGDLSMSIGTARKIGYDSALHDGLKNTDLISFSGHLGQGSSGGPVVNKYGEIVAINAAGGTIDIKIKGSVVKKIVDDAKFRPFPQISMPCTYQASSW